MLNLIITEKALFRFYNFIWGLAIPLLKYNQRIAQGFDHRILKHKPSKADLWIQAASVGESYLVLEILKNLETARPVKILLTSNTRQGLDILTEGIKGIKLNHGDNIEITFFPFDKPDIMTDAVNTVHPELMILLETEIWPGLLAALKNAGIKIMILNGRLSLKSFKAYQILPSLWRKLRPDSISAISLDDAKRFRRLFQGASVRVMSNIKFDRIVFSDSLSENPLEKIIPPETRFLVLGSVRGQEEHLIENIILYIRRHCPETVIGIFPRHLHRISHWEKRLEHSLISWKLRSGIQKPVHPGEVILWDTFGELIYAYQLAQAAFVGASLVPLGGQNFIEPLTAGIKPVIGLFWKDFEWVGQEIFTRGLVRTGADWKDAAEILLNDLQNPVPRETVCENVRAYLEKHQGGTKHASQMINEFIGKIQ